MNRYEFLVIVFLFAYSDYNVADNHILWTPAYSFDYRYFNVFKDFTAFYYYALYGKYRPAYSDYDVTDNLSLWTCSFIDWSGGEQFFHEFFYYALYGRYRPFLFFNIL